MKPARILIVEDELLVVKSLRRMLETMGYIVLSSVTTGKDAINRATELRPDLILMDIKLPGELDGIETASRIRARFDIPIIYVTAYFSESFLERAKVTEPFGYLPKPFKRRELRSVVEMALYKHEIDQKLQESEARYRAIVEDQNELICRFLPDTTLTFVNEAYCRYAGKTREELLGHSFMPLIPEDDQGFVKKQYKSLSPDNPLVTYEHRGITTNGEICWQQWTDRAIFDAEEQIVEYQSVGRDITARKWAETALRESEEKYKWLIENTDNLICEVDGETRFLFVNSRYEQLLGYTPTELIGRYATEFIHPDDVKNSRSKFDSITKPIAQARAEWRFRHKEGEWRWFESIANPYRDSAGNVRAIIISCDVSNHKEEGC